MSVWSTRTLDRDRNYVVVKHKLRGVNYVVKGVKFREGYAVLEKDSKTYFELKKIPVLRDMEEFPLLHLRKLKFITRTADVKLIYGQDVYRKYLEVLQEELEKEAEIKAEEELIVKQEKEQAHLADDTKCHYKSENTGELCKHDSLIKSPSKYCHLHILKDPKLEEELGIKVSRFLSKKEYSELREKVANKLRE